MRRALLLCSLAMTASAQAAVPISIAKSGHATVPVAIEGAGTHEFVFDTGAEGTAVYEDFSRAHKFLLTDTQEELVGQTGSSKLDLVQIPPLTVDGVSANGIEAVVLPRRKDNVPLAGIVGLDVFGRMLVDFDLPSRRVSLHPSKSKLTGMKCGDAIAASATVGGLLTIPVYLNGVKAVAVIDTGARKTRINWKLGVKLGFSPKTLRSGDVIQGATNVAIETNVASVENVRIGSRKLRSQPVLVADLPVFEVFGVSDRPAVILGMDWLSETRMLVDFPEKKAWFLPASAR